MEGIRYRLYEPGDEERILETFNLTFREAWVGPGYVDRTLEEWRWTYPQNPAGFRIMLGIAPDGRVASQYAGVPMRVWTTEGGGRELSFFHAVDSMAHPEFRAGLRKSSIFVEVAHRFFDAVGGQLDHLGFGYPVRAAWRIGQRYLGYGEIQVLDFLLRPLGTLAASDAITVQPVPSVSADVDELERELRPQFPCMTIKSKRHLDWRYSDCPQHEYTLLEARRDGRLTGLAVLRTEGSLVPEQATLGDLLVHPEDLDTLRALVAAADERAGSAGSTGLLMVQNPNLPLHAALRGLDFESHPSGNWLERRLGSRDWTAGLDQEWLAKNWQYSLGDSDLF